MRDLFRFYVEKSDYKSANLYFVMLNKKDPKPFYTTQVNDPVWDLRKIYKWDKICEQQECYHFNRN